MMKQSCYLYLQKIIKCIRNGFDDFFANIGNIYMYGSFCSAVVVVVCLTLAYAVAWVHLTLDNVVLLFVQRLYMSCCF